MYSDEGLQKNFLSWHMATRTSPPFLGTALMTNDVSRERFFAERLMKKKIYINGRIIFDFTEGARQAFVRKKENETDVVARLSWLLEHGKPEEAEMLLESYCSR